jgi:hypothetical protein
MKKEITELILSANFGGSFTDLVAMREEFSWVWTSTLVILFMPQKGYHLYSSLLRDHCGTNEYK